MKRKNRLIWNTNAPLAPTTIYFCPHSAFAIYERTTTTAKKMTAHFALFTPKGFVSFTENAMSTSACARVGEKSHLFIMLASNLSPKYIVVRKVTLRQWPRDGISHAASLKCHRNAARCDNPLNSNSGQCICCFSFCTIFFVAVVVCRSPIQFPSIHFRELMDGAGHQYLISVLWCARNMSVHYLSNYFRQIECPQALNLGAFALCTCCYQLVRLDAATEFNFAQAIA